jgi:branched-chain amino acid aminotransferase
MAVFIDGVEVDPQAATISVFDRGFLYGQAVFETLRTHEGGLFRARAHFARLRAAAAALGIEGVPADEALEQELRRAHATRRADGKGDSMLRFSLTAGAGPLGLAPVPLEQPRRILWALPIPAFPATWWTEGLALSSQQAAASALRGHKTHAYLGSLLAVRRARAAGAHDALLVGAQGEVWEAASANVFVVSGGTVMTPPSEGQALPGITRSAVLELAAARGPTDVGPIDLDRVRTADEVFLTSSVRGLVPVTRLDGRPVGGGRPGPVQAELRMALQELIRREQT